MPSTERLCVFEHCRWKKTRCLQADLGADKFPTAAGTITAGEMSSLQGKGCSAKDKHWARIFEWKKMNARFSETIGFRWLY